MASRTFESSKHCPAGNSHVVTDFFPNRKDLMVVIDFRGHFTWSQERRLLLVCNLIDGVDVYQNYNPPIFLRTLPTPSADIRIRQSGFLKAGRYAVCGDGEGYVTVWDATSGATLQFLDHEDSKFGPHFKRYSCYFF